MTEKYDVLPDLALLLDAALRWGRDGGIYAERIAGRLGLDPYAGAAAAEKALREALGLAHPEAAAADGALVMRDSHGRTVRTGRTQEGKPFLSVKDGLSVVMAVFTEAGFGELREMLDRNAMPGREPAIDYAHAARLAGLNAPPAPDPDAVILADERSVAAGLVARDTPECGWCGSAVRAERGYVPGFRGGPVDCTSGWHDVDEAAPAAGEDNGDARD